MRKLAMNMAPIQAGHRVTGDELAKAIAIAVSYTPIDPEHLYEGCIGPEQAHNAAMRVIAQFHHNGWTVRRGRGRAPGP